MGGSDGGTEVVRGRKRKGELSWYNHMPAGLQAESRQLGRN